MSTISNRSRLLSSILILVCTGYAFSEAYRLRWTADDAFISFRYARAAAAGAGLTFNPGERVEGYTNFLWTVFHIPAEFLHVDIETYSWVLSLLAFAGLLVYLALRLPRIAGAGSLVILPALCLHRHLHVFATSGLETSLFTLLLTAGVLEIWIWHRGGVDGDASARSLPFSFFLLGLAVLTRPDGALVYVICGLIVLGRVDFRGRTVALIRRLILPHVLTLALILPVLVVKTVYYGSIVPNTFYAKSASDPYISQGFRYAAFYAQAYWGLCIGLALAIVWGLRMRRFETLPAFVLSGWTAYVIYVGGDFMQARFFIPITPLAFAFLGSAFRSVSFSGRTIGGVLLAASVVLRIDPLHGALSREGITEEHRIYTRSARALLKEICLSLQPLMISAKPVIAFVGAQAAIAYYWYPVEAVEAETGLTDRVIASRILAQRGMVGHEKQASLDYLRARRVDILLREIKGPGVRTMRIAGLPGNLSLIRQDPRLISALAADERIEIDP